MYIKVIEKHWGNIDEGIAMWTRSRALEVLISNVQTTEDVLQTVRIESGLICPEYRRWLLI